MYMYLCKVSGRGHRTKAIRLRIQRLATELFFFFFYFLKKQDEHKWDTNRDIFFIINTNLKLCTCTYVKPAVEGIEPKSCLVKHSTPYLLSYFFFFFIIEVYAS